jgi:hypothetical protein
VVDAPRVARSVMTRKPRTNLGELLPEEGGFVVELFCGGAAVGGACVLWGWWGGLMPIDMPSRARWWSTYTGSDSRPTELVIEPS